MSTHNLVVAGVFVMIVVFSGEPDLVDGIIHWLMREG
jgi:hypothetical protein